MTNPYQAIQDLLKEGKTQLSAEMTTQHLALLYTLRDIYYTLDSIELSSRNIHHYDKEGILPPTRKSEKGWRKFSFFGMLWLHVVTQLRSMGYPLKSIKVIKEELFDQVLTEDENAPYKDLINFSAWEFIIASAIIDDDQLYFIALQDGKYSFVSDRSILIYTMDDTYLQQPHLNVPLASLIKHMFDIMPDNDGENKLMVDWRKPIYERLSATERGILMDIRRGVYESISIELSDGSIKKIEKDRVWDASNQIGDILNSKDHHDLSILKRQGKVVYIKQTETEKFK